MAKPPPPRRTQLFDGLVGLLALAVLVAGIAVSSAGYPAFTVERYYISQLADPINPWRHAFGAALVLGGLLLVVFTVRLGRRAPNRAGRRGARAGAVSAAALIVVGLFPFTRPIPHFAAAAVVAIAAIVATWYVAASLRLAARQAPEQRLYRLGAIVGFTAFGVELAICLAGLGHTVWIMPRLVTKYRDLGRLLLSFPAYQRMQLWPGGPAVNPIAMGEWVFFVVASTMVAALAVHELWRASTPSRAGPCR